MSNTLSFPQLLAVVSLVERYALSGGLLIARAEAATRLVFDNGVLLHAETLRAKGRVTKGPKVLDDLIGRHQASLAWVWPAEREVAPTATLAPRDASVFRRALGTMVRYGYFDDPQATPIASEFFGVSDEDFAVAIAVSEAEKEAAQKVAKQKVAAQKVAVSANVGVAFNEPAASPPMPVAAPAPSVAAPKSTGFLDVRSSPVLQALRPQVTEESEEVKDAGASRSVIANPQTALGKLIFSKTLRVGAGDGQADADAKPAKAEKPAKTSKVKGKN